MSDALIGTYAWLAANARYACDGEACKSLNRAWPPETLRCIGQRVICLDCYSSEVGEVKHWPVAEEMPTPFEPMKWVISKATPRGIE